MFSSVPFSTFPPFPIAAKTTVAWARQDGISVYYNQVSPFPKTAFERH